MFDPNGKLLRWLYWDDAASTVMGVPTKKDVGRRVLSVKVMPKHDVSETKDLFVVQVVPEKHEELKHRDGKVSSLYLSKSSRAPLPGPIVNDESVLLATIQLAPGRTTGTTSLPLSELIVGSRNLLANLLTFSTNRVNRFVLNSNCYSFFKYERSR